MLFTTMIIYLSSIPLPFLWKMDVAVGPTASSHRYLGFVYLMLRVIISFKWAIHLFVWCSRLLLLSVNSPWINCKRPQSQYKWQLALIFLISGQKQFKVILRMPATYEFFHTSYNEMVRRALWCPPHKCHLLKMSFYNSKIVRSFTVFVIHKLLPKCIFYQIYFLSHERMLLSIPL